MWALAVLVVASSGASSPEASIVHLVIQSRIHELTDYPTSIRPRLSFAADWEKPKDETTFQQWVDDELSGMKGSAFRLETRLKEFVPAGSKPGHHPTSRQEREVRGYFAGLDKRRKLLTRIKSLAGNDVASLEYSAVPIQELHLEKLSNSKVGKKASITYPVFSPNRKYALITLSDHAFPFDTGRTYLVESKPTGWKIILKDSARADFISWCGLAPTPDDMKRMAIRDAKASKKR